MDTQPSFFVTLVLCLFLGVFGLHRMYVGRYISGVLYFFTFGFFGIGVLWDLTMLLLNNFTDGFGIVVE